MPNGLGPIEPARIVASSVGGVLGDRLHANRANWLRVAPVANPAMVTMFDHARTAPRPGAWWDAERGVWSYLPWSGEFVGKWLLSAVNDLRLSHDAQLRATVAIVVDQLRSIAAANAGYLGTYEGDDRIFGANWDVWNHYHCIYGLYEWYRYDGDARVLASCRQIADHVVERLGHGSELPRLKEPAKNFALAHVLALLHRETGGYRGIVDSFVRAWSEVADGGRYVDGFQSPSQTLWGLLHSEARWERLHSIQAVGELYRITGDEAHRTALVNAWDAIRRNDVHITGGCSSLELLTGNPYDPRMIETCGTVAWMALTVDVLRLTGAAAVADELERSLWNGLLGAQAPDGSWWTYDTPMGGIDTSTTPEIGWSAPFHGRPPFVVERRPAVSDLGWQSRPGAWYLSCCAANGPRGLAGVSDWAVMVSRSGVVVNLYAPSQITAVGHDGVAVTVTQDTAFPTSGRIVLTVLAGDGHPRSVGLRIPAWSPSSTVSVAGGPPQAVEPGYHEIVRSWSEPTTVVLELDISTRRVAGASTPAGADPNSGSGAAGRVAYFVGPLLLAYDEREQAVRADEVPALFRTPEVITVDPHPTPGFPVVRARSGSIVLRDFATAGMPMMRVVGRPDVAGRAFQFGRAPGLDGLGGLVLAERLRLRSDGGIEGYAHPNEASWGWAGDTLVLRDQHGAITTAFPWMAREHGRLVLRGRPGFDREVLHELREVELDPADRIFELSRTDGTVLVPRLRLRADGTIEGALHPNEHRWERDGDDLLFISAAGDVTTRFDHTWVAYGLVDRWGAFLPDRSITHRIRELDDEVANREWQFRRPKPSGWVSVRLRPDGTVASDHPNESFWARDGADLLFLAADRSPTTRFTQLSRLADAGPDSGRLVWRGRFLGPGDITHELVEWNVDIEFPNPAHYRCWFESALHDRIDEREPLPWSP